MSIKRGTRRVLGMGGNGAVGVDAEFTALVVDVVHRAIVEQLDLDAAGTCSSGCAIFLGSGIQARLDRRGAPTPSKGVCSRT